MSREITFFDGASLAHGTCRVLEHEGEFVAVWAWNGRNFATRELCPHRAGPLSEGTLQQQDGQLMVTCPWHSAKFSVETGAVVCGPSARPLKCFPIRREGNDLVVTLD